MESVWSVSKLSTESVDSRRDLVANCVHTADADVTKQFRRVGGVYWALCTPHYISTRTRRGAEGHVPPKILEKKYFSGKCHVKFREFCKLFLYNIFSGKNALWPQS